jgi:hypothetical protein
MRVVSPVLVMMLLAGGGDDGTAATDQDRTLDGGRVRSEDPGIRALIEHGQAHSATFRRLVTELNGSDVVVHVVGGRLPEGLRGQLRHTVAAAEGVRYLFITVDTRVAGQLAIAIIGHELQHALEVARAPEVGRTVRVDDFFEKITDAPCRSARCFETSAAMRIQEDVARELD